MTTYLDVTVRPSRRDEGDGIFCAKSETSIWRKALILAYDILNVEDLLNCGLFFEAVDEEVDIAAACGLPFPRS
jgi:hypothetical protein